MTTALEAAASITSDSLIPPAAARITLTAICVLRQLRDLVLERLERARDVGLEQDVELVELALLGLREDLLEGEPARLAAGELLGLEPVRALLGELAGLAVVLDDLDPLAGLADAVEAEDLDRVARAGLLEAGAGVVLHRPDLAPLRPGDDRVADVQGAALDEHGGDRAAAGVEVRLDHRARCRRVGIRLELLDLGQQQDALEQLVEVLVRLRRDVDEDRVAAPVLGVEALARELALDLVRVRAPRGRSC